MTLYWIMFLAVVLAVFIPFRLPPRQSRFVMALVGFLFAIFMGFRHEVGGDWYNYLPHFFRDSQASLLSVLATPDPAYHLLNWTSAQFGWGIYFVNFVCALILMAGTIVFCRAQPNPWLALAVSVPYMLIVVGMGYTRQSVALGFALLGLTALGMGQVRRFAVLILLGALFHKSAVLLLPIAALGSSRNRWVTAGLIALTSVLGYFLLLADHAEQLWDAYVDSDLESEGGAIRVAMNAVPALAFLVWRRKLTPDERERNLWIWIALLSLACVPLVAVASTAIDRIALYFIPLQLYVFSRLPRIAKGVLTRTQLVIGISMYYGVVLYVWLNFATHSRAWIPYKFMPLS